MKRMEFINWITNAAGRPWYCWLTAAAMDIVVFKVGCAMIAWLGLFIPIFLHTITVWWLASILNFAYHCCMAVISFMTRSFTSCDGSEIW